MLTILAFYALAALALANARISYEALRGLNCPKWVLFVAVFNAVFGASLTFVTTLLLIKNWSWL